MNIGVLALQGDFEAHQRKLAELEAPTTQVRVVEDLNGLDGLVFPGGESTAMLKLLEAGGLEEALVEFVRTTPVLATCAGTILLAREVRSPAQRSFGLLDVAVERNAYGRQVASSIRRLQPEPSFSERSAPGEFEAVFIRAPIIRETGEEVQTLIQDDGTPVLVEQGSILAATFHPELTADTRIHQLFVDKIKRTA